MSYLTATPRNDVTPSSKKLLEVRSFPEFARSVQLIQIACSTCLASQCRNSALDIRCLRVCSAVRLQAHDERLRSQANLPLAAQFMLPSILIELDQLLLVQEFNARVFNGRLDPTLVRMALMTPSASLEDNYERLELLGTSSLLRSRS